MTPIANAWRLMLQQDGVRAVSNNASIFFVAEVDGSIAALLKRYQKRTRVKQRYKTSNESAPFYLDSEKKNDLKRLAKRLNA